MKINFFDKIELQDASWTAFEVTWVPQRESFWEAFGGSRGGRILVRKVKLSQEKMPEASEAIIDGLTECYYPLTRDLEAPSSSTRSVKLIEGQRINFALVVSPECYKENTEKTLHERFFSIPEVDAAVNKVRSEVDPDAELIIGAITDENLDGSMRVSIVATAVDGQHPEPKSVINMVHRIQNRNPGYSDFANNGSTQSFTFSNPNNSIITHGANALKLEEEVKTEGLDASTTNETEMSNFSTAIEETDNQKESVENVISQAEDKIEDETERPISNGLENFHIEEEDTPELFSSDHSEENQTKFSSPELNENNEEEDDLEIPAFLRRQKN